VALPMRSIRQSWRESCIKKGAAGDRPSNFHDKTNVSVEAGVRFLFHIY